MTNDKQLTTNDSRKSWVVSRQSGFSLIEVLLVVSILAILSTMTIGYYRNYAKARELDLQAKNIIFHLKEVQGKAISGEDQLKWGIRFVNGTSDIYETFSTASTYAAGTVKDTNYLPSTITFTSPAEGFNTVIIFKRINGNWDEVDSTGSAVTIASEGSSKTVTVTAQGNIY